MKNDFHGVIPPVTTPFGEDGRVLYDSLERNVNEYFRTELSGVLLLGSNGESVHLTEEEKLTLVRRIGPVVPDNRDLLVGLGFSTLRANLQFLDRISDLRVRAVLVSVPSYYRNRMDFRTLEHFFMEIAEHSTFPILLYNIPQLSGIELQPELVARLAAHERIAGMKDSSGNLVYLQKVLHLTRETDFQVLLGSAQAFGPSLVLGIKAGILAVACAFPELPLLVLKRFSGGRPIQAEQDLLCRVANALTAQCGVPGLKYAMDLAGREGKFCREPLLPLLDNEKREIEKLTLEVKKALAGAV